MIQGMRASKGATYPGGLDFVRRVAGCNADEWQLLRAARPHPLHRQPRRGGEHLVGDRSQRLDRTRAAPSRAGGSGPSAHGWSGAHRGSRCCSTSWRRRARVHHASGARVRHAQRGTSEGSSRVWCGWRAHRPESAGADGAGVRVGELVARPVEVPRPPPEPPPAPHRRGRGGGSGDGVAVGGDRAASASRTVAECASGVVVGPGGGVDRIEDHEPDEPGRKGAGSSTAGGGAEDRDRNQRHAWRGRDEKAPLRKGPRTPSGCRFLQGRSARDRRTSGLWVVR